MSTFPFGRDSKFGAILLAIVVLCGLVATLPNFLLLREFSNAPLASDVPVVDLVIKPFIAIAILLLSIYIFSHVILVLVVFFLLLYLYNKVKKIN